MAREHLFRGFHPDENGTTIIAIDGKGINGYWVTGNLFIPDDPSTPTQICMGTSTIRICYDVIPETVGQFTSLIDKNGNKIFEGDIVSAITLDTGDEQRAVVCFGNFIDENNSDEYIGFFINFDGIKTTITQLAMEECKNRIEVIGNIHDNPELLEGVE